MKTIVIFGATGGIGAYTALYLHEAGHYKIIAVGHRKSDNGFYSQYGIKVYGSFQNNILCSFDFRLKHSNYHIMALSFHNRRTG